MDEWSQVKLSELQWTPTVCAPMIHIYRHARPILGPVWIIRVVQSF